jgi:DNA (cytosine-5)-methyltransferase 1
MRFIDLFAGLGGFHVAARQLGGECVFASEIDERLCDLYQKNFGLRPVGDIRKVKLESVPAHDLLCAGFPCQPFSKAGDQVGWGDKRRGTVFWNIIKIIRARKPRLVLLENVAHFVRHDEGNTYRKVRKALEDEGYSVDHHQYSPHQFGVPQIRERFYMVAARDSLQDFSWPEPVTCASEVTIHSVLDRNPCDTESLSAQVLRCLETWQEFLDRLPAPIKLPSFPIWGMEFGATYPFERDRLGLVPLAELQRTRGCFGIPLRGLSRTQIATYLPSHAIGCGLVFPRWKKTFLRQNRDFFREHRTRLQDWLPKLAEFPSSLQKFEWNCQGAARDLWSLVIQFRASGVRVKRDNTAPSLVAMTTTQVPIIAWEKRYMTVRECARLQSLGELEHLPMGGAAARALGNAVNATVVRQILSNLLPLLSAPLFPRMTPALAA